MKSISESEMKIMKLIWGMGKEVTAAQLQDMLDTGWKQTTVLVFLKRLTEKGILSLRKEGRTNYYMPIVSEKEYKKQQSKDFLNELHSGSVKKFLAALYDGSEADRDEIEELKQWFEEV